MDKLIIGLTGPARSGKDTVASIIQTHIWMQQTSFAAPLRTFAANVFGIDESMLESGKDVTDPRIGISPRRFMQLVGTEIGRQIDADLWIKSLEWRLDKILTGPTDGAIVTDVRFNNEADYIRGKGGFIWHIQRPDAPGVAEHSSEAGITPYPEDIVINNGGDMNDLRNAVADALLQSALPFMHEAAERVSSR